MDRWRRWAPARASAWSLIDTWLQPGARVAILGAGNGDTLPLEQITARADHVALIDLDPDATRRARRRVPRKLRGRVQTLSHDITASVADQIATQVAAHTVPSPPRLIESPLPGAPYDLVIGDLLYSQLLYPALLDLRIPPARRAAVLERYGPALTRATVARMHVSAPYGQVLHIHDPLGWWHGHDQPVTLTDILTAAEHDTERALALAATGRGPRYSDPRPALSRFSIPIRQTELWRWPFAPGVDYFACATIAGAPRHTFAPTRPNLGRSLAAER